MFYRESGDFKKTYQKDSQTFPIKFDRWRYYFVMLIAFVVVPMFLTDYIANAVMIPFLVWMETRQIFQKLIKPFITGHRWVYGGGGLLYL